MFEDDVQQCGISFTPPRWNACQGIPEYNAKKRGDWKVVE